MSERIEGRRPALSAIRSGRAQLVRIAQGAHHAIIDEIRREAEAKGIEVLDVDRVALDAMSIGGKHQGVIAEAASRQDRGWEASLSLALDQGRVPFLIALDGVQDPGNLGALIRSAAAFGADAVLIPEDRSAPVTPFAAKAAAGALEVIQVSTVASLQAALERARQLGCWIVALAEEGAEPLENCTLMSEPLVLVVGAEGRGVSRTLKNAADALVAISTNPDFPTLNASVAGAIAMHTVVLKRAQTDQAHSSDSE